ncbi:Eco57I restriction-modification methylase domain-containing protein [Rhodopirellula europaea]|uniref:site-specific DNA-methyltransferase (adenine-specific) n=1 Tax=Rhodopirellula europaea 6C TaxID=1263867 RepID=M2AQT4_9BACT|nr:Eco57I restriction-modification methylase domain-containing protein [Rhodopirellula europaea]EMB15077.1 modification methylase [Rhodopirellula europaea 6C]
MARQAALSQPTFPGMSDVEAAIEELSGADTEARGAIFTKPDVVHFILDLVGYKSSKPLHSLRMLEPSFGHGSFLLLIVDRLIESWRAFGSGDPSQLNDSLRAVELHTESFHVTRRKLVQKLRDADFSSTEAESLLEKWLINGDFLLEPFEGQFDFVAGNPPYLRIERVPAPLMREYRQRYPTMYDRADIYIPFIERSLDLLSDEGRLGFICADRWTKNRYGGPLREKVAKDFHIESFVDMSNTQAFESEVIAYPAITVIRRGSAGVTAIASDPAINRDSLSTLAGSLGSTSNAPADSIIRIDGLAKGKSPWIVTGCDSTRLLRDIEEKFALIEEVGCKVGIGVATGADRVFIAPYQSLAVEEDRKLPLATTKDIASGKVEWSGLGVVNPFAENGKLVDLGQYPGLAAYLDEHKEQLCGRHVAKKYPANWYRTIDRIHPALTTTPKLLIPDIKGGANIVAEKGELYPHHNLYYVTAGDWSIDALRAVLLSGIAHLFVSSYSTKMRGGYFRFQAQNLRRICLPSWASLEASVRASLQDAAERDDTDSCFELTCQIYQLSNKQRTVLRGHVAEVIA